jgi:hypothetical protein
LAVGTPAEHFSGHSDRLVEYRLSNSSEVLAVVTMQSLESSVETLCETILKTDAEDWEVRNRAMLQLTDLMTKHKDDEQTTLNEIFTPNVFRFLKEPVKNMVRVSQKRLF